MQTLSDTLGPGFPVTAVGDFGEEFLIRVEEPLKPATDEDLRRLGEILKSKQARLLSVDRREALYLRIATTEEKKFPWTNLLMFAITVVTVFFFPQYFHYIEVMIVDNDQMPLGFIDWLGNSSAWEIGWGASFTFWLLAILLAHEFGHYFAGKRRKLRLTLPFFIPFPNFIGTMGAVIRFRSPIENRRDLIEVGAAGPLAGFVVAVAAIWVGLLATDPQIPGSFSFTGESILMTLMGHLVLGEAAFAGPLRLDPAAFAGWVGLLITALNLLPLSQLDGGHITYGLFGRRQRVIAIVALGALALAGFSWPVWWVYGGLALAFGIFHGPTIDDTVPLSKTARRLGWMALIVFFLSVSVRPFAEMEPEEDETNQTITQTVTLLESTLVETRVP